MAAVSAPQREIVPDTLLAAVQNGRGDRMGRPLRSKIEAGDYFFIIASCTGSFTFGTLANSTLTSLPPTFSTFWI